MRYWRTLAERVDAPELRAAAEQEFPGLAKDLLDGAMKWRSSRRQFLKVLGASTALAGVAGCRWPKENIVPATRQPVDRVPGVPVQYATAIELGGVATGVLATSFEGRPIKLEGNDKHPFSRGRTSPTTQAAVLDLYDPDRSVRPIERLWQRPGQDARPLNTLNRTWEEFGLFVKEHSAALRSSGGEGLAVLSEASSSPTRLVLRRRFAETFPKARWYENDPLWPAHAVEGARLAFGRPLRAQLQVAQADCIVSFDSDFLGLHPAAVRYAGEFAARRRADDGTMNRLYVIESTLSVTGTNADHRWPVRSSEIIDAVRQVWVELEKSGELGPPEPPPGPPERREPLSASAAQRLAADLLAHRGRAALLAGPRQPALVHALVHRLNERLGSHGQTILFSEPTEDVAPAVGGMPGLPELTESMAGGGVQTLLILGGNPVYDASGDVAFAAGLEQVRTTLHLSLYDNETSRRCSWHVPMAHFLEAWGDARAYDGTVSIAQPLIEPLFGGRTACELLAAVLGEATSGYELTRRTFQELFARGVDFETAWKQSLHDGVVANSAWPHVTPAQAGAMRDPAVQSALSAAWPAGARNAEGFEVVFAEDYSVRDGRFANNAWLQEWPDPITKLTWDNAAWISPADAEKLGIEKDGELLRLQFAGAHGSSMTLDMPAIVVPGHARGSLTLPVGYGRKSAAGRVAAGAGFDVNRARSVSSPHIVAGVRVTRLGRNYELATTQGHHQIRSKVGDAEIQSRVPDLVREATLAHYQAHPDFARHAVHLPQAAPLWEPAEYKGHKWGMAIDLSTCIGCGACVVACQAENNVPVVGKEEVARGREMHWIRIDRYFREVAPEEPGRAGGQDARPTHVDTHAQSAAHGADGELSIEVVHQPMACVHCENAPCEQVCPVAATVHDEDGLNVMVYNRCIGTRYCSNNCPYKVRRFNWFYNHHGPYHPRSQRAEADEPRVDPFLPGKLKQRKITEIEMMQHNPNVTVRSRGVMEKCTYCVQRINTVKIQAQNERWPAIPDGLITPACAQACPADAIVFGDLNDPESRVRKLHEHQRAYKVLEEINVRPRTAYLARLKNPAGAPAAEQRHVRDESGAGSTEGT